MIVHLKILSLVIHLILGSLVISYIYQLYLSYSYPFLLALIKYTVIVNLVFVILLVGSYLTQNLPEDFLSDFNSEYYGLAQLITSLLAIGLIYFMSDILLNLRGFRITVIIKRLVFVFTGTLIVFSLFRTIFSSTHYIFSWLDFLRKYVFENIIAVETLALILSFFFWSDNIEKDRVKMSRGFSLLYLSRYLVSLILVLIFIRNQVNESVRFFLGFITLIMYNLIPIIWIKYLFIPFAKSTLKMIESRTDLKAIFLKYNISQREIEIIGLILNGKSNKEIASSLFISYHTVKNHISNIFNKLNVSSRHELLHMFLSAM